MRFLNQETMSCALNPVSVLKCKRLLEKVFYSVVKSDTIAISVQYC